MALASPRTWVTGELVTSAMMNDDVRDRLDNVSAQSVNPATYVLTTVADTIITGCSITVNEEGSYLAILKANCYCIGAADNNTTFELKIAVLSGGGADNVNQLSRTNMLVDGQFLTLIATKLVTSTNGQNMVIEGRAWKTAGAGTSEIRFPQMMVGLIYWV